MGRNRGRIAAAVVATAVAAVLLPGSTQAQQTGEHAETQRALDALVTESPGAPGALVAADSWYLTSGTARVGADRPFRRDDHVQVGSITKSFVAAVLLQLVAEGRLELDAPIERYLPGVVTGNGYDGWRISVRQILQHTSGIADYLDPIAHGGALYNPIVHLRTYTSLDLVRLALEQPPRFAPGTKWEYSNGNYALAGLLVERLTGRWVGDEITDRIIRPHGLAHTSFPAPGEKAMPEPHARGYVGVNGVWADVTETLHEPSYLGAAGTITSTPDDMLTFVRALADGRIVPAAQLAEMRRTVPVETDQGADGYGLGLYHLTLSCGEAWGHYGATAGYGGVAMATDDGRQVYVIANSPVPSLGPAVTTVVDAALCASD